VVSRSLNMAGTNSPAAEVRLCTGMESLRPIRARDPSNGSDARWQSSYPPETSRGPLPREYRRKPLLAIPTVPDRRTSRSIRAASDAGALRKFLQTKSPPLGATLCAKLIPRSNTQRPSAATVCLRFGTIAVAITTVECTGCRTIPDVFGPPFAEKGHDGRYRETKRDSTE